MCPDVSSTTFDRPWRDHVTAQRCRKPEAERLPPGPSFFVAYVTSVECAQAALLYALPLQPQKKSLSCCASHVCAKGLTCPGHSPKERNRKPKRAVHGRFRSEDHGVCPKSEAFAGCPRTTCSGHICKLQNRSRVDAVQRQACSTLLPSSLFSLLPLPALSPLSPSPSPLPKSSRTRREGARPTSRDPLRNEGTEAHPLSNLKCSFPSGAIPDGLLSVTFDDLGQRCDPVVRRLCRPTPAPDQNAWSNQYYRQAR